MGLFPGDKTGQVQKELTDNVTLNRIALALGELSKGMKAVSFYPSGHPSLTQAISRIAATFEEIPLPETGLEIDVTKSALFHGETPIPMMGRAVADLNRELYLRRASKLIFLPGLKTEEVIAFLSVISRDAQQIQDEGGLERVLLQAKVSRIWANRVDYESLTEILKKEEEPQRPDEAPASAEVLFDTPDNKRSAEQDALGALLALLKTESDPARYREHMVALNRLLQDERPDRKIESATRALSVLAAHVEEPPKGNGEIARLAALGIREIATDDLILHYIGRLRDRGGSSRKEVETILATLGERAIKPLLDALSDEEDLISRKTIVDIVTRIGRAAVPAILDRLSDSRWFIVRNMVTIIGSLGYPDLAPQVAGTLAHPDLRVKKEAIKALSKLAHPAAVTALGDLCFFPDEAVALTATAALSSKKEPEAVLYLYRRALQKDFLYPHFRLAHEAIDSLRSIGTEEAVTALEDIARARAIWETGKFRAMKIHALRSLSKIDGEKPREVLRKALSFPEKYLRWEAERLQRRSGG
jgi:hypothetical protein